MAELVSVLFKPRITTSGVQLILMSTVNWKKTEISLSAQSCVTEPDMMPESSMLSIVIGLAVGSLESDVETV